MKNNASRIRYKILCKIECGNAIKDILLLQTCEGHRTCPDIHVQVKMTFPIIILVLIERIIKTNDKIFNVICISYSV